MKDEDGARVQVCPACGAENGEQAKFCRSCGAALAATADASPEQGTCGNCGEDLRPGASFCPACGAAMVAETAHAGTRGSGFNAQLAGIVGGGVAVVVALVVVGVWVLFSGSDPDPDGLSSKQRKAFELLHDDAESAVHARFENGVLRTMRGRVPIPESAGGDPEQQARYFLARYAPLYQLEDPGSEVKLDRIDSLGGKRVAVFQRLVEGVPVFGSDVRVHLSDDRTVTYAAAALPGESGVASVTPVISDVAATQVAIDSRGSQATGISVTGAELVIFNEGLLTGTRAGNVLAWRIDLDVDAPPTAPTVFVHAGDGTVVFEYDNLLSTRDRRTYTANGENSRIYVSLIGAKLWYDESGPVAGADPVQDTEGEDAHFWTGRVYDYYWSTFGRDSYDGTGGAITTYVHFDLKNDAGGSISNAFWDRNGGLWYTNGLVTLDIVAHEFTHGVVQHSAGMVYSNASGALDESFADVFAAFIDGNWTVGEGSGLGVIRTMSNPSANGHPDHMNGYYTGTDDHGGVHRNSGIVNHAAYLITAGGTHGTSGITVDAVGVGKAQRIYYKALTEFLGPSSTFMDARDGLLAACLELLETTGDIDYRDCSAVINGYAAVGLGDQDRDHDAMPDRQDNCGRPGTDRIFNPDQEDADSDGIGDACDASEAESTAFVATETAAAGETATAALIPTQIPTPAEGATETLPPTPTNTPDTSWVGEVCEAVITTLVAGGVDRDLAEVLAAPACDCLRAEADAGSSRGEAIDRCSGAVGATPTPSAAPVTTATSTPTRIPTPVPTATPTTTPTPTATSTPAPLANRTAAYDFPLGAYNAHLSLAINFAAGSVSGTLSGSWTKLSGQANCGQGGQVLDTAEYYASASFSSGFSGSVAPAGGPFSAPVSINGTITYALTKPFTHPSCTSLNAQLIAQLPPSSSFTESGTVSGIAVADSPTSINVSTTLGSYAQ